MHSVECGCIYDRSAAEDVHEQVVTKTTKIIEKSTPDAGLSFIVIFDFCTLS